MGITKAMIFLTVLFIGFTDETSARNIKIVEIDSAGLSDLDDVTVVNSCKLFKPTKKQVELFFSKAYPVDSRLSVHKFYSPCYAKGVIEYADGNKGRWVLKSSGIAGITWEGSGEVVLLYRNNKWNDPFFDTYDENGV